MMSVILDMVATLAQKLLQSGKSIEETQKILETLLDPQALRLLVEEVAHELHMTIITIGGGMF